MIVHQTIIVTYTLRQTPLRYCQAVDVIMRQQ